MSVTGEPSDQARAITGRGGAGPTDRVRSRLLWLALAAGLALALAACATPGARPSGDSGASVGDKNVMSLARKAERAGDYATAATFYRKAANARDETVDPEVALGRVLYTAGNYEQAERAYRSAIKEAPKTVAAHYGLGKTLLALDRPAAAIDSFDAGIELDESGRVAGYIGKGVALDMRGRHAEAQRVYQEGLARAPDNIKLLNNYALSLALAGDLKTAAEVLEPLVRDGAASERVRQNLALVYGLRGESGRAGDIANYDLSPDAVDANLAYYKLAREFLGQAKQAADNRKSRSAADTSTGNSSADKFWAQLGAFRSIEAARRKARDLEASHPALLADRAPTLERTDAPGEGTLHRVRVGPFSGAAGARRFCAHFEENGQPCVVTEDNWGS